MNSPQIKNILASISGGFRKYNLTIFIVIIASGLSVAIVMLSASLQISSSGDGSLNPDLAPFDQATIERVDQLRTSNDKSNDYKLPSGRFNPFSE